MYAALQRGALLIPTPKRHDPDQKHLFVILNDPVNYSARDIVDAIPVVSITSVKQGVSYDTSCELFAGDHPFIRHHSYVAYSRAEWRSAAGIERGVNEGDLVRQDPFSMVVFARVIQGLLASNMTPRGLKRFFETGQLV